MILKRLVILSCISTCGMLPALSQPVPKHELRGVYITTTNSLDWPKSLRKEEQQASLRKIVRDMQSANLNAIFFQVRARGDAYYRSSYEPWAENLTGVLGKDPGWDPLQFLIDEARAANIEVHAWFNVYKIRGPVPPSPSSPQHPVRAYPQWSILFDNEWWFDPGLPEVRAYLLRLVDDLVGEYGVDGVCFDFIRYPGKDFPDEATFRRFGKGEAKDTWRRNNINTFVAEAYRRIIATRPMVKVGAAPVGNYGGSMSAQPDTRTAQGGRGEYYQESRTWLKSGSLDYLAPQVYWTIEFNTQGPDFTFITREWQRDAAGRDIYISIGAYKPEVLAQIPDQIVATRMLGPKGQIYFRHENVAGMDVFGNRYQTVALIPPMPWKDSIPPYPPRHASVNHTGDGAFIRWQPSPKADDGDTPLRYVVYRSGGPSIDTNDPKNIIGITSGTRWHDPHARGDKRWTYAITALDKGNNESVPARALEKAGGSK